MTNQEKVDEHNQICRACNPTLVLPPACVFCGKPKLESKINVCPKCLKEAVKILDKEVAQ